MRSIVLVSLALLACHGGPFDVATEVDIGRTKWTGREPMLEDHIFDPAEVRVLGLLPPAEIW